MKNWWFLFICIFGIGISYLFYPKLREKKPPAKTVSLKKSYGPYFLPICVSSFSSSEIPCLIIKIEEKMILAELDLGFCGETVFSSDTINSIFEKTFDSENMIYGLRGKGYKEKKYIIPKIEIDKLTFWNISMNEQSDEFLLDSCILKEGNRSDFSSGRVGWKLFRNSNILLDLGNSKIAFCDSITSLSKHGFPSDEFVKTPLYLDRGLVEISIEGPNGPQIWTLDTGATWNMLNTNIEHQTFEEIALDPNNTFFASIKVGDRWMGPMPFHKVPIKVPININGVLGMEFFKTHQVFIDFAENLIYIRRLNQSENPKI